MDMSESYEEALKDNDSENLKDEFLNPSGDKNASDEGNSKTDEPEESGMEIGEDPFFGNEMEEELDRDEDSELPMMQQRDGGKSSSRFMVSCIICLSIVILGGGGVFFYFKPWDHPTQKRDRVKQSRRLSDLKFQKFPLRLWIPLLFHSVPNRNTHF